MISTCTTLDLSGNPIMTGPVDICSKETSWIYPVSILHLCTNQKPQARWKDSDDINAKVPSDINLDLPRTLNNCN
jgi:hypothetical protein